MIAATLTDEEVIDLIACKAGWERMRLRRPMAFGDLQLSLEEYFAVVVELEDRFHVEIDDLVAVDCATLGGLIDRLKASVVHWAPSRHHA